MSYGRIKHIGILAAVLVTAAFLFSACVLYILNPEVSRFFPPCPFHYLTGFYCPGCGSLRAFHLLLHGDFSGAFRMNPLMILSIIFIALLFWKPAIAAKPWTARIIFFIILAYLILRNIPVEPFLLLQPPGGC